jgi:hypothetical protein
MFYVNRAKLSCFLAFLLSCFLAFLLSCFLAFLLLSAYECRLYMAHAEADLLHRSDRKLACCHYVTIRFLLARTSDSRRGNRNGKLRRMLLHVDIAFLPALPYTARALPNAQKPEVSLLRCLLAIGPLAGKFFCYWALAVTYPALDCRLGRGVAGKCEMPDKEGPLQARPNARSALELSGWCGPQIWNLDGVSQAGRRRHKLGAACH